MANEEQATFWTENQVWLAREEDLDAASRPFGEAAMDAAKIASGEKVVDIGCGTGRTTIEIARRVGPQGKALGFDIAPTLLARAREIAGNAAVDNVEFVVGDAQTYGFEPTHDVVYSRFGVMFFEDPIAAFRNLRSALQDGGRLAFACWQDVFKNMWMSLPTMAASSVLGGFDLPPEGAPGPFSLADGDHLRSVLEGAGYADIEIRSFETTMDSVEAEVEPRLRQVLQMGPLGSKFAEADEATQSKTISAVKDAAGEYLSEGTYRLPAAAWVVTARPA